MRKYNFNQLICNYFLKCCYLLLFALLCHKLTGQGILIYQLLITFASFIFRLILMYMSPSLYFTQDNALIKSGAGPTVYKWPPVYKRPYVYQHLQCTSGDFYSHPGVYKRAANKGSLTTNPHLLKVSLLKKIYASGTIC